MNKNDEEGNIEDEIMSLLLSISISIGIEEITAATRLSVYP
ncbi:MAG TPA: hypothetical protein VD694_03150 [Nitrososphaeraceae archaeon]|nr:hypothetical protein [Nitrososphaeraceae archaeon]